MSIGYTGSYLTLKLASASPMTRKLSGARVRESTCLRRFRRQPMGTDGGQRLLAPDEVVEIARGEVLGERKEAAVVGRRWFGSIRERAHPAAVFDGKERSSSPARRRRKDQGARGMARRRSVDTAGGHGRAGSGTPYPPFTSTTRTTTHGQVVTSRTAAELRKGCEGVLRVFREAVVCNLEGLAEQ
jgi:hypothetical protein